jgi:hypothetical protein
VAPLAFRFREHVAKALDRAADEAAGGFRLLVVRLIRDLAIQLVSFAADGDEEHFHGLVLR